MVPVSYVVWLESGGGVRESAISRKAGGRRGDDVNSCPYLLSSETTAKGTGLAKLAGKEDPVELDSNLTL